MSYINKEAAIDLIESMIADKGVAFNPHKLAMALKDMESVEIPEAKDTDLISRQSAIDAVEKAVFKGVAKSAIESLPPVEPVAKTATTTELETDDENELKFYYVESLEDYWVGRRLDNFYYATWHERLGFIWSHSKYLPWGEHIVDENTLWKEHTYPSEPIEIPFTEWIVGFVKKYFAEPKPVCEDAISRQDAIEALDHIHIPTQAQREYAIEIFEKIPPVEPKRPNGEWVDRIFDGCLKKECDQCGEMIDAYIFRQNRYNFCPNCGADCRGEGND